MLIGLTGPELAKRKQEGQEVSLPKLHSAQMKIIKHPARHKVVAAGRRFGKSYLGVGQAMIVAARGGHAWWCGPSYPLTQEAWDLMKHWARQMPGVEIREAERRVMFPPGSERDMPGQVQIKSADNPDSLVSVGLDFLVVDEAARVKEEAWTMSLRPTLADRQGSALFISTPKGRSRWFYRLWKAAHEKDNWAAFQFPTSANPLISPEEIEEARQDMPALLFRQEFLAEFVEATGYMFLRTWFKNVIPEPPKGRYIRFWDLAASPEGDYSVGSKVTLLDGKYIVADVVRGRWDWPNLRRIITDTALEDGPEVRVGVEQAALELHAVQDLQSLPELASIVIKGIPVRPASASVRALYENLPRDKRAKAARAASWLARAEAGNVVLVEAPWNNGWLDRVCDFPLSGSPDDEIDSMSGAVQMIGRPRKISFGWA